MFREAAGQPAALSEGLQSLIREALELEAAVEAQETLLKDMKTTLLELKQKKLPEALASAGSSSWTGDASWGDLAGSKVEIKGFVSGSLPKDAERRQEAIEWLEGHDAAPLIKTTMELAFSKSQHNEALSLASELRERGYSVLMESGVHASTLQAMARERLEKGEEIPLELLGLFAGTVAKITLPKRKA